ncbi:MAG TPA: hypothetical protein VND41_02365 [Nitrososphaerales archaeon]|nr:hypothetical protein [Nitrososphaerales archaeon]
MASAVLVQRPREQAQPADASQGVRILSVESKINSISLTKTDRDVHPLERRPFDFDVDLSESVRTEDTLSVRYSFTFGRPSSGPVCKVSGTALVRFFQFNPTSDFHTLGNDVTNEMAVEIFRKNYEAVYLLHDALSMEAPSPWITQEVSLASRNQIVAEQGGNP